MDWVAFSPHFASVSSSSTRPKLSLIHILLLSSCDTYTGSGAYAGATCGSILGSAIGGLSGGPRGADMGTMIGMAGGAAVGAAIGSQADQKSQQQRESVYRDRSHHDHHSYQDVYKRQVLSPVCHRLSFRR